MLFLRLRRCLLRARRPATLSQLEKFEDVITGRSLKSPDGFFSGIRLVKRLCAPLPVRLPPVPRPSPAHRPARRPARRPAHRPPRTGV